MISLEIAKKLADAGFEPEYKEGCYVYRQNKHGYKLHLITDWTMDNTRNKDLPAPNSDQLTKAIEIYNVDWCAGKIDAVYFCIIYSENGYLVQEEADTPENAKGKALFYLITDGRADITQLEVYQPFIKGLGTEIISEYRFIRTEEREGIQVYVYEHRRYGETIAFDANGKYHYQNQDSSNAPVEFFGKGEAF